MAFNRNKVRRVVEDRLSNLPDELIHKILFCVDMKVVVQTCLLSSRWKLLWTSMPSLNFSSDQFRYLPKFAKFVTDVLSHRNHQVEVSSVKLRFSGVASHVFVKEIANYAFSHNVQELTVTSCPKNHLANYPSILFSSQSLKCFTLTTFQFMSVCIPLNTPLDFPALTTLHLSDIVLCGDLFSKCVNLNNLTLRVFIVEKAVKVFEIITPRLSKLMLIRGRCSQAINVIAPQLENLTIIKCSIKYLNVPTGLSSLCYKGHLPLPLSKDGFHSLNKVTISMYPDSPPYEEEDARKTINMLQELHSARYLTLDAYIVEYISSFPELLSHHPSPFRNLICLTVDSSMKNSAYKVKMSTEARNNFFENSPSATFVIISPKVCLS